MLNGKVIVIIIPVYNVEKHIRSAIESLPKFVDHIVVVNDFSHDGTKKMVEGFSDRRVVLLEIV
jgi:glycosyltransferase involved in cell wall biosynthesis